MKHIRQINSVGTDSYTIVITDGWESPLEEHPSILEHPEIFEIADNSEIPNYHQYVEYESGAF
jgi:hypothetical protein